MEKPDGRTTLPEIFAAARAAAALSDSELRLWLVVRSYENPREARGCYAGTETLAAVLKRSESHVKKTRAGLASRGWLNVTRRGPMEAEVRAVVPPQDVPVQEPQEVPEGELQANEVPEEVPVQEPPPAPPIGKSTGSTSSVGGRFPKKPSKVDGRYSYPAEFEECWSAYPSRSGANPKKAAYRAWRARLAAQDATTDELHAGVERYSRFCKATGAEGSQYVKTAAAFFGPDEHWAETWEPPRTNGARKGAHDAAPVDLVAEAARRKALLAGQATVTPPASPVRAGESLR